MQPRAQAIGPLTSTALQLTVYPRGKQKALPVVTAVSGREKLYLDRPLISDHHPTSNMIRTLTQTRSLPVTRLIRLARMSESTAAGLKSATAEGRIAELGFKLPVANKPAANYVMCKRVGNMIYTGECARLTLVIYHFHQHFASRLTARFQLYLWLQLGTCLNQRMAR